MLYEVSYSVAGCTKNGTKIHWAKKRYPMRGFLLFSCFFRWNQLKKVEKRTARKKKKKIPSLLNAYDNIITV